ELLVSLRAGDIASQRGRLEQAGQYYARAEAIAKNSEEKPLSLINVLKARAESYARAGQPVAARKDLERAIESIEDYRSHITDPNRRNDFFDAIQDVFDRMIQLQARQFRQGAAAFDTAEQARARTLLEQLSVTPGHATTDSAAQTPDAVPRPAKALTLDRVRAALPADLTLISYSVSSEGTLIFVTSRGGFDWAESPATTETLDRLVQDYLAALRGRVPVEQLEEQSRRLYQLLVAPVESKLATRRLCIAPDKALHRLPFAALQDGKGDYLIRSHVLTGVPSASTLVYCLDRARAKGAVAEESLLAVGNPLINRDDFPDLKPLPEAEREVTQSAGLYARKVTLIGPDATKARLLSELAKCDVAHFSTHCLVEETTPWLAALVLTPAGADKDEGLLRLSEFSKIGLLRARLVILSACQSGLGQYYRGEGIVSLVRPFLAQGVPTVVASLWPVDSQATAELMIDFHRARRQNNHPLSADALHSAQLQLMQSKSFNHPYYWAPFVVIGSGN
ncbi:MAG TPA: CHAT domain-containing protein, partial [Blastocatellia bacterium]|nr:CHAT domain-containing protein [Blastocatellia bacterium]